MIVNILSGWSLSAFTCVHYHCVSPSGWHFSNPGMPMFSPWGHSFSFLIGWWHINTELVSALLPWLCFKKFLFFCEETTVHKLPALNLHISWTLLLLVLLFYAVLVYTSSLSPPYKAGYCVLLHMVHERCLSCYWMTRSVDLGKGNSG